ncbi:hypothetical protein [Nocardia beijingensis]
MAYDAGIAGRTILLEFDSFEQSRRARVRPTRRRWSPSPTASIATSASSKASTDRSPVGKERICATVNISAGIYSAAGWLAKVLAGHRRLMNAQVAPSSHLEVVGATSPRQGSC